MILITRGAEPKDLIRVRQQQLIKLRSLGRTPVSDDIVGYKIVSEYLWRMQYLKCCYCEQKIMKGYNDVEHYRPKGRANRNPGCQQTHGYWWLAFCWENLLFACPSCNRSAKNDNFPLAVGSVSLRQEEIAPGGEIALLLNPASFINPVEHLQFIPNFNKVGAIYRWTVIARNGSETGLVSIDTLKLNNSEILEMRYDHYVNVVLPYVKAIQEAFLKTADDVKREYSRAMALLSRENSHVAFNYDVLKFSVPDDKIYNAIGEKWPEPFQVGI